MVKPRMPDFALRLGDLLPEEPYSTDWCGAVDLIAQQIGQKSQQITLSDQ